MKTKKFKDAVTKTYTTTEITQMRDMFFRQSRFQGVEKIEEACPASAALIALGYDVNDIFYGNGARDLTFWDIVRKEFNMTDAQISKLLTMNDDEELPWQEILEKLK